jgi:hypothetical protein
MVVGWLLDEQFAGRGVECSRKVGNRRERGDVHDKDYEILATVTQAHKCYESDIRHADSKQQSRNAHGISANRHDPQGNNQS